MPDRRTSRTATTFSRHEGTVLALGPVDERDDPNSQGDGIFAA